MYQEKILRFPHVRDIVGVSRSTVFRLERDGKFPRRRQLGPHSVGWLLEEVLAWVATRREVESENKK